ncbi:MAG: energy transducer TonB [Sphingobium sp.]|nr:energy transducer TonB [Sphingobium sp.]
MSIGAFIVKRMAIFGLAFLATGAAAADKSAQHFKPTGPWAMEYADQTCRLIRNFSDGNGVVTLAFEKTGLGAALSLGLAGETLRTPSNASMVRFRYNVDNGARSSALLKTVLVDGRDSFIVMSTQFLPGDQMLAIVRKAKYAQRWDAMDNAEAAAASKITSISFTDGFIGDPEFEIGPMAAPLKAMNACVEDLVRSWGVDPRLMRNPKRMIEPMNSPRYWLSMQDYPEEMWRAHKGGVVPVRLLIDENGAVTNCIPNVALPGPFEDAVCRGIKKRARFRPALDADGKPMKSYWQYGAIFPRW